MNVGILSLSLLLMFLALSAGSETVARDPLAMKIEAIRVKYSLPALAGATITAESLVNQIAVGVRKKGADTPVTIEDCWHLGSDTKMMTALLVGTFVAEGRLSWDSKILSFFPEFSDKVPVTHREITIGQVLAHEAGLVENVPVTTSIAAYLAKAVALGEGQPGDFAARLHATKAVLESPSYPPNTFHYSNCDYMVIASLLERLTGKTWEALIQERVFLPLGMKSAGFGGMGTPGQIDQPWPHTENGKPTIKNGPDQDNLDLIWPAGSVHCSLADWSRFLTDQLKGSMGLKALLPTAIYQAMQTPYPHSDYGYGWTILNRSWAGGKALWHNGSNTMNYSLCWLAPAKGFGVLACTNQGGDDRAFKACDEVVTLLMQDHLKNN